MGAAFAVGDVIVTLYVTFILRYITQDARTLIWIGFVINIVAVVLSFWVVESPVWLVSVGRELEARDKLFYIARFNRVANFEIDELIDEKFETQEDITNKKDFTADLAKNENLAHDDKVGEITETKSDLIENETQKTLLDWKILFKDRKLLCNLVLMTIFWTTSSLNYYLMIFYLKYIPGNIYVNTTLSCVADLLGYACSGIIMDKFGVKLSFIISFLLASVGGLFLVIFFNAEGALIATFVLFAKFGIALAFNISYLATP